MNAIDKTDTATAPRLVKLQINLAGAWRDVITFDVENEDQVLQLTHTPGAPGSGITSITRHRLGS